MSAWPGSHFTSWNVTFASLPSSFSPMSRAARVVTFAPLCWASCWVAVTPATPTPMPTASVSPKLDLDYSAIFRSGKELGQTVGSAFWLQTEQSQGLGLQGVGFRQLLEGRARWVRDYLVGVPHACRQMRQQTAEAMRRLTVRRLMGLLLRLRRLRWLRRLDRVTFLPVVRQFLVGIQQRRQRLPHMPLDVVRQKAQKQVRAHTRIDTMMNRPHAQVQPLEATEGLLHLRQALVRADTIGRRKGFGPLTCADHIDPVELFLAFDRRCGTRPTETAVGDLQPEVLGHLVTAHHLPGLHADRGGRQRFLRAPAHLRLQAAQVGLGSFEQPLTLLLPPLGQQRVVAGDEPFAREVRRPNLGQVLAVECRALQAPALEQLPDRFTPQRRDPAEPGVRPKRLDLRLREQAAVADEDDAVQRKASAQRVDLVRHGRRVGRVAGVDVQGDGAAVRIGQQAVDDDRQALLAIAVVAVARQRAGVPFVVAAADVVQDDGSVREVAHGQFLLDGVLAAEQPVHRRVQFLAVGIADAEFVGERGGVPIARRGEFGTREQDALGNQRQDKGAWAGRFGSEEVFQVEPAACCENRLDMAVGPALGGAESVRWGDEGFAGEGPLDEVKDAGRQVGEVAEGAVLDLAVVAVGLPQQVADVRLAAVLADDLGHMHGGAGISHAGFIGAISREPSRLSKYSWLQKEAGNSRKRLAGLG